MALVRPGGTPSARAIEAIEEKLAPLPFDRIYGAFWERVIPAGAKEIVRRSVMRYLDAIDFSG